MRVCVVGCGIVGVSTALRLRMDLGDQHDVVVITDDTTPNTTGDGAAGIWGPYLLEKTPAELQQRWSRETHDFAQALWSSSDGGSSGISLLSSSRVNTDQINPFYKDIVFGFRNMSAKELAKLGRLNGRHTHGCSFVTFTIEPVLLLPFLMSRFVSLGGSIATGVRVTDLSSLGSASSHDLGGFDVVVNCTGVWAGQLVGDPEVGPLRGQVMRVRAPWLLHCVLDDEDDGNYVIPNQTSVVFGGTHQRDWNTSVSAEDKDFIWRGCHSLMGVANVEGAEHLRDWVGLRPGRPAIRIEREVVKDKKGNEVQIVHNYGHGGSGITTFWGCAKDAVKLVKAALAEKEDRGARRQWAKL